MFDYIGCSDDELVQHILTVAAQTVSSTKRYHKQKGNKDVVDKIERCRLKVKQLRLIDEFNKIEKVLEEDEGGTTLT